RAAAWRTSRGTAIYKPVASAPWPARPRPSTRGPPPSALHVLADDSGLEVAALGGAPGVHSGRFAALNGSAGGLAANRAANTSDGDNNAKRLGLLKGVPLEKPTGRHRCTLARAPLVP